MNDAEQKELNELRVRVRELMAQTSALIRTTVTYDRQLYLDLIPEFAALPHEKLQAAFRQQCQMAVKDQERWNLCEQLVPIIKARNGQQTLFKKMDGLLPGWRTKTDAQLKQMQRIAERKTELLLNRQHALAALVATLDKAEKVADQIECYEAKIETSRVRLTKVLELAAQRRTEILPKETS